MLLINPNKYLFYFMILCDLTGIPADILICFICIYFVISLSPLFCWSGVLISASFEGCVVSLPFAHVPVLIHQNAFGRFVQ